MLRLFLPLRGRGGALLLLMCTLLLAALAGCGGTDPTATAPPPTNVPVATAAPAPPNTDTPAPPSTDTPAPPAPTDTLAPPPSPVATPTTLAAPTQPPAPPAAMPHVPALDYHLINVPAGGEYNVSASEFRAQMAWLHDNGYQAIGPAQLLAAMQTGASLPAYPVLITFDDNQYTPYKYAVPVLKEYGWTATFFIMTVSINKDGFMDDWQIKQLADEGFVIGGHTWDHRILVQQTDAELERQLKLSGDDLVGVVGQAPEYFAYPAGIYDARVVAALKAHGYKAAFRLQQTEDPIVDSAFMIPRRIIPAGLGLDDFAQIVHSMEP